MLHSVNTNKIKMASVSETSYWINFFTSGGIPAGDATQYAIIFTDNRITKDMLLDLSKEYLTDMGITRLGDVISILKHAKQVYNQEARDKVMKSTSFSSSSSSPYTPSPRKSTAAARMVNHFTSKHPEAAPMSQTPVPKLPPPDPPKSKRKVSVFERLGGDDSPNTVSLASEKLSSPSQDSVFRRLGGKAAMKRAASSTSLEDLDALLDKSPSLPYAGILKSTPSSSAKKRKASITVAVNRPQIKLKNIVKTVIQDDDQSTIQRPEVSTTTEGVLSDFAKKPSVSLKDRLGRKTSADSSSGASLSKSGLVSSASTPIKKVTGVQKRLGLRKLSQQSSAVVSSTQQKQKKAPVKGKGMASENTTQAAGGVFSRLGKKKL